MRWVWKVYVGLLVVATFVGCQSTNTSGGQAARMFPFAWGSKSASPPGSMAQLPVASTPKSGVLPSMVTPASDPTSLSSKVPKFGPEIYVKAGEMQESAGNVDGAIQQFKKALEIAPNNVPALISFARLYDRQGRFDDAVPLYQRATQADPKSSTAFNDLGLCYARQLKFNESAVNLQRAIQLQPDKKKYRNNLATVYVEAGRYDEALVQLTSAHGEALAHYNLAYLLQQKGKTNLAVEHLRRALEISPQFEEAQAMLAKLNTPTTNFVSASNPAGENGMAQPYGDSNTTSAAQPQQGGYGSLPNSTAGALPPAYAPPAQNNSGQDNSTWSNSPSAPPSNNPSGSKWSPSANSNGGYPNAAPVENQFAPSNNRFPNSNSFVPPDGSNASESTSNQPILLPPVSSEIGGTSTP